MELIFKILYRLFVLICIWSVSTETSTGQTMDYLYDPTFMPPNIIGRGGGGNSILCHQDNRYTIAGAFQFNEFQIKKFVRFNQDGSIDESFSNDVDPLSPVFMQFFQEDYLYLGTTTIGYLNFDGSHDPTLKFFELSFSPYTPSLPPDPKPAMYQIMDDNKIMVAGRFSPDSNNLEDRRHLVRIHPDGSPDPSFEPLKCEEPFHARLIDLYPTSDGKWMVTGEFNYIEGFESPNIARLNADFSVDTTFKSPFPDYTWSVRILKRAHPQKLKGAIDEQNRVYIYRFEPGFLNPAEGLEHLRLRLDGSIDSTFQVGELLYYSISSNQYLPGIFSSVAFEPDGTLIIGGRFRKIQGYSRGNIAKLNEDGSLVQNVFHRLGADTANWQNGSNPDIDVPAVTAIVRLDNGGLMVGGRFSRYDGHDQWGLVRLMPSPVSVEERKSKSQLIIYPNPAGTWIQIAHKSVERAEQIDVFSLSGQRVLSISPRHFGGMVDVSKLPPGMYVVQTHHSNRILTGKFVKE